MTLEIAGLLAIFAIMVYLFLSEKLPVDLTAFLGLAALIFGGFVRPDEAFAGFASPAVITTLFIFILGGALQQTGVADMVGAQAHRLAGGRELWLIVVVMLASGLVSSFMPNIAATAVMIPAVASLAQRASVPPARLFMPLSFGAVLGGTTTLVGTPPNILAGSILAERLGRGFSLFDFLPVGAAVLLIGTLYMVTIGRRFLPARGATGTPSAARDLARIYQLEERLFTIRIPDDSPLHGQTLGHAQLGRALHSQVLAIKRHGTTLAAPGADTVLRRGDVLLASGRIDDIQGLLRVQGVTITRVRADDLPSLRDGVTGLRLTLGKHSPFCGQTLRKLRFREQHGTVVVGIERDGVILQQRLGDVVLQEGDTILTFGGQAGIAQLAASAEQPTTTLSLAGLQDLAATFFLVRIPDGSPLCGLTLGATNLGQLVGLTVMGLVRGQQTDLGLVPQTILNGGDQLLVAGDPAAIMDVLELGAVRLENQVDAPELESPDIGVIEATIAPRSQLAGHSLRQLTFRERYGVQAIALWRGGKPRRTDLADLTLRVGDGLLLQGSHARLQVLLSDPDFVVLTPHDRPARRTRKAPVAVGGLLLLIGMVVTGWQPIEVAAFTAGVAVVLGRALTMQEAYRAVEWRLIFLLAAILPLGIAMERTGTAALAAHAVTDLAGPYGPYAVLASLVVMASLLSQSLDSGPAVVVLAPVTLEIAAQAQLSPLTLFMGIALGASAAFSTPFSHKAHLLVMSAGGYRAVDYVKVGTPLTVLMIVVVVLLVPLVFPFR
jgi:di/tricarboxylate transporter